MNSLHDVGAADGGYRTLQLSPALIKMLEDPELGNNVMQEEEVQYLLEGELKKLREAEGAVTNASPCFSLSFQLEDAGMTVCIANALRWVHNLTINGVLIRRFELE